jgi:hypothetical protein
MTIFWVDEEMRRKFDGGEPPYIRRLLEALYIEITRIDDNKRLYE